MSEHLEQVKVIQWAKGSGLRKGAMIKWPCLRWLHCIPNGAFMKSPKIAAKMKREGLTPGVSDLCLPFPNKGFHGLYIEMKYGKNKPTKEQKEFIEYAARVGYLTAICYSAKEAIEVLEEYLS